MESIINYEEDCSIKSSKEVDSDEENKDLGVGRSYECVFCKRGFNTAQALGGHMNIHRKDRARNKPDSDKKDHDHVYTATRLYHQIPSSSPNHHRFSSSQDHHPNYAAYFPASTSRPYGQQNDSDRDHQQPLISGDWRMRLSLEFPPSNLDKNGQEKDLDLELRLGYDS
ncbi:hypothetical protein ACS0TY_007389 [Phlomoides rotata]